MESADFTVSVDEDLCMGSGYCYTSFPDLFTANADGTARPAGATKPGLVDQADKAEKICPSGAISVHRTKEHP